MLTVAIPYYDVIYLIYYIIPYYDVIYLIYYTATKSLYYVVDKCPFMPSFIRRY